MPPGVFVRVNWTASLAKCTVLLVKAQLTEKNGTDTQ